MQVATRVIIAMGAVVSAVGFGWLLTSAFDYFAGRKNGNPQMMDQGTTSMISGGVNAVISGGVATAIVATMNALISKFSGEQLVFQAFQSYTKTNLRIV